MKKILFLSSLLTIFNILAMQPNECEYRNILIFLDQEGVHENIGNKQSVFLTAKLQSAISQEAAPILVNASLWNNFIERRLSIKLMSQVTNFPEEKALTIYKKIGATFTHWFEYYKTKNINILHAKQLALEKVNEEFYTHTKYNQEFVTHDMNQILITYLTNFDKNNWDFYTNDGSFYLLIPKKYIHKLRNNKNELIDEEILLGLKTNHLDKIVDIENPIVSYLNQCKIKKHLPEALNDFFITTENHQDLDYKWNILLSGHGGHQYLETTTEGKIEATATPLIADLAPSEFICILNFLNNSISTNCFYYTTCFAGGTHIKLIYDDNNNPLYNYTIICGCLSDGLANCLIKDIPLPSLKRNPITLSDLTEYKGKWDLKIDHLYQWPAFFNELEKNSFENSNLCWLNQAFYFINSSSLSNTPTIRLPYQQSFVPVLEHDCYILNDQIISAKIEENSKEIRTLNRVVFIDTNSIQLPLVLKNTATIVSTLAGNAYHYFQKIESKKKDNFLNLFGLLTADPFDTYFIIDELIIKNNKNSFIGKTFEATDKKITLKNVLVYIQKDYLIRIIGSFNNKYYMITIHKAPSGGFFECKGIFSMPEASIATYLSQYNYLKNKALHIDL